MEKGSYNIGEVPAIACGSTHDSSIHKQLFLLDKYQQFIEERSAECSDEDNIWQIQAIGQYYFGALEVTMDEERHDFLLKGIDVLTAITNQEHMGGCIARKPGPWSNHPTLALDTTAHIQHCIFALICYSMISWTHSQ